MATIGQKMLAWLKERTAGYKGVAIENFSMSWRDGLAFCALVDSIQPGLLDFNSLSPQNAIQNHNLAYGIASKHLHIPELLEAEDMLEKPEQKSVMTYLGQFYQKYGTRIFYKRSFSPMGSQETPISLSYSPPPIKPKRDLARSAPPTPIEPIEKLSVSIPSSKPICAGSGKELKIGDKTVEFSGKYYLLDHFSCTNCKKKLPMGKAMNVSSDPYCEPCGRRAFIQSKLSKKTFTISEIPDIKDRDEEKRQEEIKREEERKILEELKRLEEEKRQRELKQRQEDEKKTRRT